VSNRDTPRPRLTAANGELALLEENIAMLSESISRPSIPLIEELRASQAALRASTPLILRRLDRWAAFAFVIAASSAVYYVGSLLLSRWQLF
jgi:hypothetical protein